jgi:hypothetical protein
MDQQLGSMATAHHFDAAAFSARMVTAGHEQVVMIAPMTSASRA